jgi:predicted anti-sigma-YlaC factor YlaD
VGCEDYREALSARLDGEDDPAERGSADAHLRRCAACRRWYEDAAAVTRFARIQPVTVTPQAPKLPKRRRRLSVALRLVLGGFGAAQFFVGIAQAAGLTADKHSHGAVSTIGTVTSGHLWHESAAWNVAIGAGFAWIAIRRTRPAGALPMLTAFVALLAMLSVGDITGGSVDGIGLLSHGFVVAGYAIVVALTRPSLDPGVPPPRRLRPDWRTKLDKPAEKPKLRLVPGQATASVAGQQRKAA